MLSSRQAAHRREQDLKGADFVSVQVGNLSGDMHIRMNMALSQDIAAVKQYINAETGIPVVQQCLTIGSTLMENDGCTLRELDLNSASTVQMTLVRVHSLLALSGSLDGYMHMVDLQNQCDEPERVIPNPPEITSPTLCMEVDWTWHRALCGCRDGGLRLWNLESGDLTWECSTVENASCGLSAEWDKQLALHAHTDGKLQLYKLAPDGASLLQSKSLPGRCCCMSFDWKTGRLLTVHPDACVKMWLLRANSQGLKRLFDIDCVVACLSVDWSSQRALFGGGDGVLRLLCFSEPSNRENFKHNADSLMASAWGDLPVPEEFQQGFSVGQRVICKNNTATSRWHHGVVDSALPLQVLVDGWKQSHHWDLVQAEAYRMDEFGIVQGMIKCVVADWLYDLALSGGSDKNVLLWNLTDRSLLQTFSGHRDDICCLGLDGKSKLAVSGSYDWTLRVWDLEKGITAKVSREHMGPVTTLAMNSLR